MRDISRYSGDRRALMPLLLIGDEQEDMILRYLDRGEIFVCTENGGICGVCVVTDEGGGVCEIRNIAVYPRFQRRGIGRAMIDHVIGELRGRFSRIILGTGDSPLTVPFYESCGFVRTHRIPGFFTENYDHPIIEAGVRLVDMIYFAKDMEV